MATAHTDSRHEEPIVLVQGERVGLGPLRRELLPDSLRWRSDLEVSKGMAARIQPHTLESIQAWYE
jgi:hypothetical protein